MSEFVGLQYRVAPRIENGKTFYTIERVKDGQWVAFGGLFSTFQKADAYLGRLHRGA